jgi:hypothetical protein
MVRASSSRDLYIHWEPPFPGSPDVTVTLSLVSPSRCRYPVNPHRELATHPPRPSVTEFPALRIKPEEPGGKRTETLVLFGIFKLSLPFLVHQSTPFPQKDLTLHPPQEKKRGVGDEKKKRGGEKRRST